MITLNFPSYSFRFKSKKNKPYIFDPIRKKFVVLYPEEWVRQHTIQYLHQQKKYPLSLMSVEKKISVNGLSKRYDIAIFNTLANIHLLVECKAPNIEIKQATFDQMASYNMNLNTHFFMITNGLFHYYGQINKRERRYHFLNDIPNYNA